MSQFKRSETAQAMLNFGFTNNELFESLLNHTKNEIHKQMPNIKSRHVIGEILQMLHRELPVQAKDSPMSIRNYLLDVGQGTRIDLLKSAIKKVAEKRKS